MYPKGKKRFRRRKPKERTEPYFTKHTQAAIERWQDEEDAEVKKTIFANEVHPAFDKLTECLIAVHKFFALHTSLEELRSDCVAFLYEQLPKYDRTRGFKAFSYFNQIARNYLIVRIQHSQIAVKRFVPVEEDVFFGPDDMKKIADHNTTESPDDQMTDLEDLADSSKILTLIYDKFKDDEEQQKVMECIQFLFANAKQFPFLNKRAIFSYLRAATGITSKKLTAILQEPREEYKRLKKD